MTTNWPECPTFFHKRLIFTFKFSLNDALKILQGPHGWGCNLQPHKLTWRIMVASIKHGVLLFHLLSPFGFPYKGLMFTIKKKKQTCWCGLDGIIVVLKGYCYYFGDGCHDSLIILCCKPLEFQSFLSHQNLLGHFFQSIFFNIFVAIDTHHPIEYRFPKW